MPRRECSHDFYGSFQLSLVCLHLQLHFWEHNNKDMVLTPQLCEDSPVQDISPQAVQVDPGLPVNQVVSVSLNSHTYLPYLWCHPIKMSHRA